MGLVQDRDVLYDQMLLPNKRLELTPPVVVELLL